MPKFGQRKTKNGKEYVYRRDSRGGNYGSWQLVASSAGGDTGGSTRSHRSDFSQSHTQEILSEEEAFDATIDAMEVMSEHQRMSVFRGEPEEESSLRFDPFDFHLDKITKAEDTPWTANDRHDATVLQSMMDTLDNPSLSTEQRRADLQSLLDSMHRRSQRGELLHDMGGDIVKFELMGDYRRTDRELSLLRDNEPVNENPHLLYSEGELGAALKDDEVYGRYVNSPYLNAAIRDVVRNGEEDFPLDLNEYENREKSYYLDEFDRIKGEIIYTQGFNLAYMFPNKELKNAMDTYEIDNVYTDSFVNGREYGNVYSVAMPNGDTMSFSVYEHRNSDSIIINGKRNWGKNSGELPYAADSKYQYFAEVECENYREAADMLCFFLKDAHNGTLKDTEELIRQAPRIDWNTRLAQQLGSGYMEFLEGHYPQEARRVRKNLSGERKSDQEILDELDF